MYGAYYACVLVFLFCFEDFATECKIQNTQFENIEHKNIEHKREKAEILLTSQGTFVYHIFNDYKLT